MKKVKIICTLILCTTTICSFCQVAGFKPFEKRLEKNRQKMHSGLIGLNGPDPNSSLIEQMNPNETYNIFCASSVIPITFSRIEMDKNKNYHIGNSVSMGYGYTLLLSKATKGIDNNLQIEPGLMFGLGLDAGIKEDSTKLKSCVNLNAMLGFNKIALMVGYDFLNKNQIFGISYKIDLFSINKNSLYVFNIWKN